jgi:hypothetical protein
MTSAQDFRSGPVTASPFPGGPWFASRFVLARSARSGRNLSKISRPPWTIGGYVFPGVFGTCPQNGDRPGCGNLRGDSPHE